jgi:hypothetical protein
MKGYLSVCAIYRNEARYLAEWLEFHLLTGVEHFFLYNNSSTDDHRDVLAPYLRAGVVTLTDWPQFPPQVPAYDHCLEKNRHEWRWIAFIDLDEFLFSPRMVPVPQVLGDYEDLPAVAALWIIFGTSDHETPPPGLVLENYTWRRTLPRPLWAWKSIVDPSRTRRTRTAHEFRYTDPGVRKPVPAFASLDDLRLNHYITRSEQELKAKLAAPEAATGGLRRARLEDLLRTDPRRVEETILAYAPALRDALDARGISTEDGRPVARRRV